jgi:hypothetical protein
MKVGDLQLGGIYRLSKNPLVGYRVASTPMEEASRLALYILKKREIERGEFSALAHESAEALIYLGTKMTYGGRNGDQVVNEYVHHFVRPNGKRVYIYGNHIKHIQPFTRG